MVKHSQPDPAVPSWVQEELDQLAHRGLLRAPMPVDRFEGGTLHLGSKALVDFTANDYLGLASHPDCLAQGAEALRAGGCGARGSRLVTGDSHWQRALEQAVADWLGDEAAVLFPSGYQANVGALSALLRPGDQVFSDAQNHASIVDGCRLSRAEILRFDHLDAEGLDRALSGAIPGKRLVVVTDSLFSMDGTRAPLADLADACRRHGALLVVDEAHALGVLGPAGRGLCTASGVRPTLRIGTFSKALGSHGAFITGAAPWIQYLLNRARALIYSTALPPASLGASLAAVRLVQGPKGDARRETLRGLSQRLIAGLGARGIPASGEGTPLISIAFANARGATVAQDHLMEQSLIAWAFRPPTVPKDTSRLRISLCALHSTAAVDRLIAALPGAIGTALLLPVDGPVGAG